MTAAILCCPHCRGRIRLRLDAPSVGDRKRCQRCAIEKPVEAFGPRKRAPDGLAYICRECDRKRKRAAVEDDERAA